MKLPLILFAIFSIIDIALIAIIENTSGTMYLFLAAIFLEIAIFGCIIIYLINKHNDNNDKKDD